MNTGAFASGGVRGSQRVLAALALAAKGVYIATATGDAGNRPVTGFEELIVFL